MSYEPATPEDLTEIETQARDLAKATKAQYDGFVEAGFSGQESLLLTRTWLQAHIGRAEG